MSSTEREEGISRQPPGLLGAEESTHHGRRQVLRWLAAAALLPLATYAAQTYLWPTLTPFAWVLFCPVIFVAPRLGGPSSGIAATLLSAALVWWRFIPEYGALFKQQDRYLLSVGLFLLMGVAFAWFHAALRKAEAASARSLLSLRRAEQRKDELLAAIADPVIVVNERGQVEYVNALAASAFGYAEQEMIGLSHDALIPSPQRAGHPSALASFFRDPKARLMGAGHRTLFARRRDGSEFPVEVSLNPITTASGTIVSTVVRDVSERQTLELAARMQGERLASAIECIPDLFRIIGPDGTLVAFNAAFAQLFSTVGMKISLGMPQAELVTLVTQLHVFDSEDERERFYLARKAGRLNGSDAYDVRFVDGRTLHVTMRALPSGGDVAIGFDVSEDLRQKHELQSARTEAEAANHAKTEFLASMSHELRTPMNAVLGFAQLLQRDKRDPLSEGHREMVKHIISSGEHLLSLIDDVLDLARIEKQGLDVVAVAPVSVDAALREVVQTLQPQAQAKQVELRIVGSSGASVRAARRHFVQMLLNLASNGIKYNRPGGAVTFTVSTQAARIRITVTDTGIGVPTSERANLFRAFHRAGQEAGPIAGTGIGLSITKRIAELMGGEVGYQPLDPGSAFWVELPATSAEAERRSSSRPPPPAPEDSELRGVVLYVEDNAANVDLMSACFETLPGVELLVARTAEAGLASAHQQRPDLILMDLNLPGMSGIQALQALRNAPDTANIPVIAVSAAAFSENIELAKKVGFQQYLTKPIRVEALEATLTKYLSPAQA